MVLAGLVVLSLSAPVDAAPRSSVLGVTAVNAFSPFGAPPSAGPRGSTTGGVTEEKARASSEAPASEPTFTPQDRFTTPRPTQAQPQPERRWQIRQAPLAGAEPSWGPPGGQMPEYAEVMGPEAPKGPPPRGTARIVAGAIVGPAGLALTIAGIVGATTSMLGDHKRLSVPMIGGGLVATALGTALLVDGVMRRRKFLRWEAGGKQVAVVPVLTPGRFAGATLLLRF